MDGKQQQKKGKLNIELPEEAAEGIYSNFAVISHSPSEFILDFVRVMPGLPKARVKSRIILTPQHAKRLIKALEENIRKFEAQHGEVHDARGYDNFPMNFGGPQGEA